jgi:hypothetical protein
MKRGGESFEELLERMLLSAFLYDSKTHQEMGNRRKEKNET